MHVYIYISHTHYINIYLYILLYIYSAFDRYDADGDGYISISDLTHTYSLIHRIPSSSTTTNSTQHGDGSGGPKPIFSIRHFTEWVRTRDISGHGSVSFPDFAAYYYNKKINK